MSGWIDYELPDWFDEDLAHRGVPESAIPEIRSVATIHCHRRDDRLEKRSASQVRKDLEGFENAIIELKSKLTSGPLEAIEAIITTAQMRGVPDAIENAHSALELLDRLIGDTWQRIEPQAGTPGSPRTWAAVEIANILERAGHEPTTKQNGIYVQALGIFFKAVAERGRAGRDEPDPREIAKTALAQRKNLRNGG